MKWFWLILAAILSDGNPLATLIFSARALEDEEERKRKKQERGRPRGR